MRKSLHNPHQINVGCYISRERKEISSAVPARWNWWRNPPTSQYPNHSLYRAPEVGCPDSEATYIYNECFLVLVRTEGLSQVDLLLGSETVGSSFIGLPGSRTYKLQTSKTRGERFLCQEVTEQDKLFRCIPIIPTCAQVTNIWTCREDASCCGSSHRRFPPSVHMNMNMNPSLGPVFALWLDNNSSKKRSDSNLRLYCISHLISYDGCFSCWGPCEVSRSLWTLWYWSVYVSQVKECYPYCYWCPYHASLPESPSSASPQCIDNTNW